ncbi:MAG TPA: MBL fold metallo-hydrolase [Steroidobacteraceae bacterium]|nr:MBL fold metallo-hydrolase [Steroidobacteraceae bacterium]
MRTPTLFLAALFLTGSALAQPFANARRPIEITYLGNAGWKITDDKVVILVDPYLSEFRKNAPAEQMTGDDPIAQPDPASIDAHITKADYILITHGHDDHMLDAPYISKKTGAVIVCTESAANIARAWGVGDQFDPRHVDLGKIGTQPLIVVRGGEDFQFQDFSLEVIPSLHTALMNKRYNDGFWADDTPPGLKAPLHESDYREGGTLVYLLRIAGHRIFIMGSMNYIERNVAGLRPDIAIIGAGIDRKQIYHYTDRLMHALGSPAVVFPTHWDDYGTRPRSAALKQVATFVTEVQAASPATRVIVPEYFKPTELR